MHRLIPALMLLVSTPALAQEEPLAGWSDGTMFLRSPDNEFLLFPNGRFQVDGYFFKRDDQPGANPPGSRMPTDSVILRRARIEMFGWIGRWFGFNIAGDFAVGAPAAADPVAQSWIATTDDFMLLAPYNGTSHENALLIQAGQFDAPFTLENRTSDKYFDFMERSITVRDLGEPNNKEVGVMANGLVLDKAVYYSVGVFNGDGQNFRNVDNNADLIGRAWVAPAKFAHFPLLENATVGGSFWIGERGGNGLILNTFTTQGGFAFTSSKGTYMMQPMELHQHGDLRAWALEADIPIHHKYGVRFEYVNKNQDLDIDNAANASAGRLVIQSKAKLDGWCLYGEAWYWLVGDDTIIGPPGLQLPPRYKKFGVKPPVHGVMLASRLERLDMNITSLSGNNFGIGSVGVQDMNNSNTAITSWELGVNYWYSKRFRATFNYVLNILDGTTAQYKAAKAVNGGNDDEHEFLFRLAVAL